MAFSVESASKLAKALKVTIYSLEEIKYSPVAERMLKEIEEIFK